MVPLAIFQTHKTQVYVDNKLKIKNAQESWKKYDDFSYHFYDDEACEQFMREELDRDVYTAYMKCPLVVMKADLWRYCIIYKYGGIYADMDTVAMRSPSEWVSEKDNSQLIFTPENEVHFCQWVFAAPKGSLVLKDIIDLSVQKILNASTFDHDHFVHEFTGPGVFSSGIFEYIKKNKLPMYTDNKYDYIGYNREDHLCVHDNFKFHGPKNMVNHLFTGQDSDGWCNERERHIESKC